MYMFLRMPRKSYGYYKKQGRSKAPPNITQREMQVRPCEDTFTNR